MDDPFSIPVYDIALRRLFARQALIRWQDAQTGLHQSLGRLSESDDGRAKLTFCADRADDHLLLHFHLPVRARPSQPKSVKHMHLVIPVEGLSITFKRPTVRETELSTRSQLQRDGMALETEIVHVRLQLDTSAIALMPLGSRPVQTQLSPAPAQLLRHLRSLTKTDAMDVFLKFGPVSTHVDTIRQDLKRGSLQQPRLNLDAMYGRGVRGGINAWEHYLYNESDLPSDAWNPFLDKDPPPYEDVIAMGQKEKQSPDPPPEPLYRASADGEEIGWRAQGSTSPLLVQGIETYAYAPRGQKRKATSPPQVVWNDGTTEEDPSPPPHRSHSIVVDAISATCEAKDILRSRGDVSDWSLLKKPQLLLELQEWLIQAWKHDPQAHHTYLADFSSLGRCARDNDVFQFNAVMSTCQASFLEAVTSASPPSTPVPVDLLEQVSLLRDWMNKNLCRNAGAVMMDMFVRLTICARETMDKGRIDVTMKEFNAKKAACVAIAFYTFGERW